MFARLARAAPAAAMRSFVALPSATDTRRVWSRCATVTPSPSLSVSAPLAPFTVTASAATVAATPCGSLTGSFAILDMFPSSGHDAEHFAALPGAARLAVRHDALRRRHDRDAEPAQHLRQRVLAAVGAEPRARHALEALDHRLAGVVLQRDDERLARAVLADHEIGHVALVLQDADDRFLHARGLDRDLRLAGGLAVPDAREEVGNGVVHAHRLFLTSSPCAGPARRRASSPRGASPGRGRTCCSCPASGP